MLFSPPFAQLASLVVLCCASVQAAYVSGPWPIVQQGTTGVSAMQLAVVSETKVLIYDKVENNPLTVNGHKAWAAELDLNTRTVRALNPLSNSFCATGSFISNGTMINSGGNPVVSGIDLNGLQGVRLFTPCDNGACDVQEYTKRVRLGSKRWYPSSVRIEDGSIMIYGGSISGGFINHASVNNPTYEYYPPKNILGYNGLPIPSQFLIDTLNGNGFPVMALIPDGRIFIAANRYAILLNRQTGVETRLPDIPNGVRITYPFSAGATLLPQTPANNFQAEIMLCGGSTVSDTVALNNPTQISTQTPATSQCSRLLLTPAGIAAGWKVETMPQTWIMPELIILPDLRILIVNGAKTGVAGYGNVGQRIGASNADNPSFTPLIYDPTAAAGSRFSSSGLVASNIARMYHSTASLTPNGTIVLAGSNPNDDVTTTKYATEYRLEWIYPPYMTQTRPTYTGLPAIVNFGSTFQLSVTLPVNATSVTVVAMDLGFATHGVHMDQRAVVLSSTLSANRATLTVTAPASGFIYPPGPAFIYVVTNTGVPSFGKKTLIGTGASPPVDQAAIDNMLANTPASFGPDPSPPLSGEGSVATQVFPA